MSTTEPKIGDSLTPDEFAEKLESTKECFRLVGGTFGGRGETETVLIANYSVPMSDFMDDEKHIAHARAAEQAATVELPLEVTESFRYAFDCGEEWFRIGNGAFLQVGERKVPVTVVSIFFVEYSLHWVCSKEASF